MSADLDTGVLGLLFGDRVAPDGNLVRENFQAWFSGSEVVTPDGHPLVLYHGSNRELLEIDFSLGQEGPALFTTTSPKLASDFALYRSTWSGANVNPLYVRGRLLVVDGNGLPIRRAENEIRLDGMERYETIGNFAARKGFDCIVFREVRDDVGPDLPPLADVYVVLPTASIKSALGNSGLFDRHSDSLTDWVDEEAPRERMRA